jgi:hypothetical protein
MDVTELLNFKPKTVPKRPAPEDIPDDIDDTDDPSNSLTHILVVTTTCITISLIATLSSLFFDHGINSAECFWRRYIKTVPRLFW